MSAHPSTLEQQVRLLLDEKEILNVFHRYSVAIDTGDEDAFVDCFTPDATWSSVRRSGERKHVEGSTELRRFAEVHTRAPGSYHKHLVTNSIVTVSGDTASAFSYFLRVDAAPESGRPPFIFAMGTYTDALARCSDGRWRITSRFADRQE